MIKFALAGIGGYGSALARSIYRASEFVDCQLAAAVRSRREEFAPQAEECAAKGGEIFDDAMVMFEEMKDRCDGVFIATSIESHMPMLLKALEYGYHAHLEKPPAATVQEVDTMRAAVEAAGKCCIVGFQTIHSDEMRLVKDRIVSGKLGKPERLVCRARWPRGVQYYSRNNWAGRLRKDGSWVLDSPSMNALAHQINNMLYLASDKPDGFATPTAVRGELYVAGDTDSHDTAAIEIQTAEGPPIYFIVTHCCKEHFGPVLNAYCPNGVGTYTMTDAGSKIVYNDGSEESCPRDEDQRAKMVMNLVEGIVKDDPSLIRCDLSHTRNMVLALNGAHESSEVIHRIPSELVHVVDEGTDEARNVVDGLDEYIEAAAANACLFSDLDSPPAWAVATKPYDVTGYDSFPQQFRCD